ncbi:hypothetical protein FHS14_003598 [Paenibacillus baekrokdamisoli]|uniref:hypothetical protein n=1 Tax=Paenibacillus baekrokdamisoli TaxID=1712516 RepID=UPI0013DE8C11|nr:hypothetical protein [Paenibacillus baekrokdamisoli]MBB3070596.1 hypothetical protein [Paenibacillus baekrokdamisoli]
MNKNRIVDLKQVNSLLFCFVEKFGLKLVDSGRKNIPSVQRLIVRFLSSTYIELLMNLRSNALCLMHYVSWHYVSWHYV